MDSGVLEVCFRRDGNGWWSTVCPEGHAARPERRWRTPKDGSDLYRVLFGTDDAVVRDGRWRMRVTPHLGVPGDYPDAPWSSLTDPYFKHHVFDREWTLAEKTDAVGEFVWSGETVVVGDDALREALRAKSVPGVEALTAGAAPPRNAVLIVGRSAVDVAAVQRHTDRCALVVWCGEAPTARATVPELVAIGAPPAEQDVSPWLARLLTRLRLDDDPEQALRNAAVVGDHARYADWWLRGPLPLPDRRGRPRRHRRPRWRDEVDRIAFEGNLRAQVKALVQPEERRVFVALVPAGEGAGLERFGRRDFTLDARASVALHEIPKHVAWKTEAPGETLDDLCVACGAGDVDDLALRLARLAPRDRVLLLRVTHPAVARAPGAAFHLDDADLRRYLSSLRVLAGALAERPVRVFVYVPVVGPPPALPDDFARVDEHFLLLELEAMPSHIDRNDLSNWMQREQIELDPVKLKAFLDRVEGKSYEQVLVHLEHAYGKKLGE